MIMKTDKQIELFVDGQYVCTTGASKTCREAVEKFVSAYPQFKQFKVRAWFKK